MTKYRRLIYNYWTIEVVFLLHVNVLLYLWSSRPWQISYTFVIWSFPKFPINTSDYNFVSNHIVNTTHLFQFSCMAYFLDKVLNQVKYIYIYILSLSIVKLYIFYQQEVLLMNHNVLGCFIKKKDTDMQKYIPMKVQCNIVINLMQLSPYGEF